MILRRVKRPKKDIDPDGLLEYSVVYTDRSLNHMSKKIQTVMNVDGPQV